jgi:hypothetical protein
MEGLFSCIVVLCFFSSCSLFFVSTHHFLLSEIENKYLQSVPSISKTIPCNCGAPSVAGCPRGAKRRCGRVDEAILMRIAGLLKRGLVDRRFVMQVLLLCKVRENMLSCGLGKLM